MVAVIKFILLLMSVLTGYLLGYTFTEVFNISKYPIFDFEGFRCRQCLSFHIAWITSTIFALMFGDLIMLLIGIAFAFALFMGLKIDQKQKTVKVDDVYGEDIEIITEGDEIKVRKV